MGVGNKNRGRRKGEGGRGMEREEKEGQRKKGKEGKRKGECEEKEDQGKKVIALWVRVTSKSVKKVPLCLLPRRMWREGR